MSTQTSEPQQLHVAVLGDGAFGTAFSTLLAANGHHVTLWCYNKTVAQSIAQAHENNTYLPEITLSPHIVPTLDVAQACKADVIFEAIPVPYLRQTITNCKQHARDGQYWISLSKGIEHERFLLPTEVIREVLDKKIICGALSGPSFAHDLALGQPTVTSLALEQKAGVHTIAKLLNNNYFSCVITDDVRGVQYAGALKNICALGVGMLAGAGFGCNTQVRFLLHALDEIKQIIVAHGGKAETLYGPAGIGDLVLTCFNAQSRNYRFGFLVGKEGLEKARAELSASTTEGLNTIASVQEVAEREQLSLPLCQALVQMLTQTNGNHSILDLCK